MKSILENRPALAAEVNKGWLSLAERLGRT